MHILVTGAAGFLGARLVERLLAGDGPDFDRLTAIDLPGARFPANADPRVTAVAFDMASGAPVPGADTADLVFHLAGAVSGACEADLDLGLASNLHAGLALLDQLRAAGRVPRLVFASSIAVYGGDMPPSIPDDLHLTPQSSYGAQKAALEQIIADFSRRGLIDGRSLRLPTISVRPGAANAAASGFASAIIREPLSGRDYACPVGPNTGIWILSPRRVIEALIRAAALDREAWGSPFGLALPGLVATAGELQSALRTIAGDAVADRVTFAPDPAIERLALGWPARFDAGRARALGFVGDTDIATIIAAFIADDLHREGPAW